MTWFEIKYGGQTYLEDFTGADEKTLSGLGFHGYATKAEAEANPNSANIFTFAVISPILAGVPAGGAGGVETPTAVAQGAGTGPAVAGTAIGGAEDVIKWLSQGSLWVRVAEAAGGLLLLYVGLKASVTPAGQQVKTQGVSKTLKRTAEVMSA